MNSKSDKNATLHLGDDLTSLDNAYKEEPTEENFQKIRRYIPRNENEMEQKRVILQQIEDERIKAKFHRLANFLPLMKDDDLMVLAADIKKIGLLQDIVLHEGKILDGRNRFLACLKAKVKPRFTKLPEGIDPFEFVKSQNLRRDLSGYSSAERCESGLNFLEEEEKRAKERMLQGKKIESDPTPSEGGGSARVTNEKGEAIKIVANQVHVSHNTLRKAIKIKDAAKTNLEIAKQWKQARKGKISIARIYKEITEEKPKKPTRPKEAPEQEKESTKKPSKKFDMESFLEHLEYFINLKEMDEKAQSLARQTRTRLTFVLKNKNKKLKEKE